MEKRKRSILLSIFILILTFLCNQTQAQIQAHKLIGKYAVGSFLMKHQINIDSLKKSGACDFEKIPFDFQSNDTVRISHRFGKEVFGDSIFRYEVNKKNIIFIKGDRKIILPYVADFGIIRINVNHRYLKRLDLCFLYK